MKIVLISIDGFGIGSMSDAKVKSNTWQDLLKNSKLNDFNFIKEISNEWKPLELDYLGADSFLGHLTMSGIKTNKLALNSISEYMEDIMEELARNNYDAIIEDGLIVVHNKFIIYDNFEADHGLAINIIGNGDSFSFKKQLEISKKIRKIIKNPRLISFTAKNVEFDNFLKYKLSNGKYFGIDTPKTGIYNKTFEVEHFPAITNFDNSFQKYFINKGWKVYQYGKFANIINIQDENIINDKDIDIKNIFANLELNLKDNTLHCINIQQTDLAGHSSDPKKYIEVLNQIDQNIKKIIQDKDVKLLVTSDHGNNPYIQTSSHTREFVPLWINDDNQNMDKLSDIREYLVKLI